MGFIENTAMRHRWGGGREVTVTSRLHRQKDTERQRKTEENVERRPVVTPRYESGGEAQALVLNSYQRLAAPRDKPLTSDRKTKKKP